MMAKCTQPRFTTYMMICYLSSIPVQMNCASVNHEQPNDNQEASFPDSSSGSPFPWNKMRLPDHVVPLYYELLIHPNLTTLTFTGTTKIGLTIKRSTNAIVLHSKHLEITSAAIKRATGNYQLEEPTVLEYLPNDQIALLTTEPLLTGQNYSVTISYALINLLKNNHTAISSNGRASLINNAFLLVSAGRLPIDKAMDLTLFLKHESKIMPVFQGMSELVSMYKLMEKREMEDVENRLKAYIVNLFKSLIDRQSWSDDGTVSERMLRSSLLHFACVRKYQPCVDKAEDYFKKWRESNGTLRLPRDVKMAVYATGAQHIDGWDFLFQQYKTSLNSAEKNQIEFALAFTRNKDKLQWFDLGSRSIAHMVTGLTNQYSTKAKLEEVNGFFESLKENGSQLRCVQQAKETIVENIRWMDENLERLKIWLEDNSSENTE